MTVSPRAFGRLAVTALLLNIAIVLTGAAVRVTGSGLGCPTWPACEGGRIIGPWEYHAVVEWGNRLFTSLISVVVMATLVGSILRRPRRRELVWLSSALVGGVVAQAVLGGVAVLVALDPPFVMAHFLLSMVIVVAALVLVARAHDLRAVEIDTDAARLVRLTLAVAAATVVLGTLTTASGPHSGADDVRRLTSLELAATLHGLAVMALVAAAFWTRVVLERTGAGPALKRVSSAQLWVIAAQGAVGFVQYQTHLPRGLVELHVAGATALWATSVWLVLRTAPQRVREARRAPRKEVLAEV